MNVKPHSATGTGKVATTVKLIFDLRAGIAARDETIRRLKSELAKAVLASSRHRRGGAKTGVNR